MKMNTRIIIGGVLLVGHLLAAPIAWAGEPVKNLSNDTKGHKIAVPEKGMPAHAPTAKRNHRARVVRDRVYEETQYDHKAKFKADTKEVVQEEIVLGNIHSQDR